MSRTKAAVVHSFDRPPRYGPVDLPAVPAGAMEVEVIAAALHPRVRSAANGSHYTSSGALPLVPGIDGVGRDRDGRLRYFVLPDTRWGSMAERATIDPRRSALLPAGVDPVTVAAALNPAMSSWIALRRRIAFTPGQSVLILGATGNAGRMAIQISKHLGTSHVIAAGRDPARLATLAALGADDVIALDGGDPSRQAADLDEAPPGGGRGGAEAVVRGGASPGGLGDAALGALAAAAADVDVVIDYLWGSVTEAVIPALLRARSDRGRRLTWVQIGSVAGPELTLPSEWLRAARLEIVGSGQGSVSLEDIVAELPALAEHVTSGGCVVDAAPTPLADVESAWTAAPPTPGARIVFVP